MTATSGTSDPSQEGLAPRTEMRESPPLASPPASAPAPVPVLALTPALASTSTASQNKGKSTALPEELDQIMIERFQQDITDFIACFDIYTCLRVFRSALDSYGKRPPDSRRPAPPTIKEDAIRRLWRGLAHIYTKSEWTINGLLTDLHRSITRQSANHSGRAANTTVSTTALEPVTTEESSPRSTPGVDVPTAIPETTTDHENPPPSVEDHTMDAQIAAAVARYYGD